jgi:hypothetical protein
MVQFNLLPDVKIEYIKTQARMRVIVLSCVIVSIVLTVIFTLLFINARVLQPAHMKNISKEISDDVKKVQSVEDLDKIITVQKQLSALPALHTTKKIASRIPDFLSKLTPQNVKITDVDVDFATNKMTIKGTAPDLATVNKLVDTLKFTNFQVNNENGKNGKAFSQVVLSGFSLQEKPTNPQEKASFDISFNFDAELFNRQNIQNIPEDQAVSLIVPNITSTRSSTEKPRDGGSTQPQQQGGSNGN